MTSTTPTTADLDANATAIHPAHDAAAEAASRPPRDSHYNFGYLDESTKRMLRRALLKAVAIPGYQVPFGSREMPLPYGWGTGGIQVTAAIIGADDVLKVIDQGADDTTNAINIRRFFARVTGVATTTSTARATIVQTRHRIPESALREGQIMVFQVPTPEPLRWLEPSEKETRTLHALAEYGGMHVKLYEDIAQYGRIVTTYDYPVIVNRRYMMRPSPIPKFDNPKLDRSPALMLFGAGREKRVYAVPPYTSVKSLDFEDHPFTVEKWDRCCELCGAGDSYLDEIIVDDSGTREYVCSDSEYCAARRAARPSPLPSLSPLPSPSPSSSPSSSSFPSPSPSPLPSPSPGEASDSSEADSPTATPAAPERDA